MVDELASQDLNILTYTNPPMKAYKYRLYPSKKIETKFNQVLNSCRYLYNSMLEYERYVYEKDIKFANRIELNNLLPDIKVINPSLKEVHSQILQNVNDRVIKSFNGFFTRVKNGAKAGYPRFKNIHRYNSFNYPQSGFKFISQSKIKLSKIGEINIKLHRAIKGKVKTLTIMKTPTNKWFAVFCCEIHNIAPEHRSNEHIGVDMGLTKFATLSNGLEIDNPRYLRLSLGKLKSKSKQLSKKQKGSCNRLESRFKLAKLHEKVSNQRLDFLHKESKNLVNSYSLIAIEDLDVREMNDKYMQLSINDASWVKFRQLLTYKAEEAGCKIVCVEPRGTTQECSKCGKAVPKRLWNRLHKCPNCGLSLSRDLNSAFNILNRAHKKLRFLSSYSKLSLPTEGHSESNACGDGAIAPSSKQEAPYCV